jgi:hypothetical protein
MMIACVKRYNLESWPFQDAGPRAAATEKKNVRRDHVLGDVAAAVQCQLQESFRALNRRNSLENLDVSIFFGYVQFF